MRVLEMAVPSAGAAMGATVLAIDDSAMMRRQVRAALAAADFAVVEATDCEDGLEKLRAMPAVGPRRVCDFMMPRMNGIEFLARYRESC